MATPKAKTQRAMSKEHKAALAKGREEGLAVRRYLEVLEGSKRGRGRQRTPATIQKRLNAIEAQVASADALSRLHLLQEKKNLQAELAKHGQVRDIGELEKKFIKVAKTYGERKGIGYGTWRAAGVTAATLQKAGIPRTRG